MQVVVSTMNNDAAIRFLLLQLLKLEVLYEWNFIATTSNFNNGLFIEGRKTWFAILFFPNAKIFDLPSYTTQEYTYMGGMDPLVAAFACNFSLFTAVLTHGLLLFGRVPIHRRWCKALKSRVVHVKYEEKGVTLLWI